MRLLSIDLRNVFEKRIKDNHFDLVILNPKMLKCCVQNFLDLLFRVGFSGPIIFSCSVKGIVELETQNTGRLLACVQRPFKIVSLLECIRRLLSKYEFSSEVIISIGNIQFCPGSKLIKLQNGQTVNLTEKETNILKYLYRYRDRIVSKEVLLNEVWSHTTTLTTHTLETYIYRLRKKIRVSFAGDELIVTKENVKKVIKPREHILEEMRPCLTRAGVRKTKELSGDRELSDAEEVSGAKEMGR